MGYTLLPCFLKGNALKGNALVNLGRYEEAMQCCDKAIQMNPNYSYTWYNKGLALSCVRRI